GSESYEIELPNGGLAVVLGNLVHKGKAAGNPTLLSWGAEGASNPDKRLFVVNNTFVNDLGKGTFIQASGATLVAKNNLFVGAGTPSSTGALSADNLSVSEGGFVDRNLYDYRLKVGSPAIDKAVPVGMADQFSLIAVSEYVQPLGEAKRASVRDVGAYELPRASEPNADAGATTRDSGVGTTDAGIDRSDDAGAADTPDAAASQDSEDDDDEGADASADGADPAARKSSGCALSSRAHGASGAWLLAALALLAAARPSRCRFRKKA
ncbi:MAG TPA: hypothetical protein VMF89_00475, partial [Polyangiales bacterium]|nr:hypothetical protein [Polyangiales bacterium]